jgi:Ribbon-helix-helix domain
MPESDTIRWTITVSKETDLSLRRFLGTRGMKKGDLSKFVEEAVRWRVLDASIESIRQDNDDLPADELQALIDEAVREVRAEHAAQPSVPPPGLR